MAQQNKSLPIGFGAQNPLCSWLSWREAGWWVKWSRGMQICSENTSQARRQVTLWYFCLYCFTKGVSSLPAGSPRASPSISWFSISSSGEAGGENPVDLWGPVSYRHSLRHSCMGGSCLVHEGVYSTQLHHQPLLTPSLRVKRGLLSRNHPAEGGHENPWAPYIQEPWWGAENPRGTRWCDHRSLLSTPSPLTSLHTIQQSFWGRKAFPPLLCLFCVNILPVQTLSHLCNYYWPPQPRPPIVGL